MALEFRSCSKHTNGHKSDACACLTELTCIFPSFSVLTRKSTHLNSTGLRVSYRKRRIASLPHYNRPFAALSGDTAHHRGNQRCQASKQAPEAPSSQPEGASGSGSSTKPPIDTRTHRLDDHSGEPGNHKGSQGHKGSAKQPWGSEHGAGGQPVGRKGKQPLNGRHSDLSTSSQSPDKIKKRHGNSSGSSRRSTSSSPAQALSIRKGAAVYPNTFFLAAVAAAADLQALQQWAQQTDISSRLRPWHLPPLMAASARILQQQQQQLRLQQEELLNPQQQQSQQRQCHPYHHQRQQQQQSHHSSYSYSYNHSILPATATNQIYSPYPWLQPFHSTPYQSPYPLTNPHVLLQLSNGDPAAVADAVASLSQWCCSLLSLGAWSEGQVLPQQKLVVYSSLLLLMESMGWGKLLLLIPPGRSPGGGQGYPPPAAAAAAAAVAGTRGRGVRGGGGWVLHKEAESVCLLSGAVRQEVVNALRSALTKGLKEGLKALTKKTGTGGLGGAEGAAATAAAAGGRLRAGGATAAEAAAVRRGAGGLKDIEGAVAAAGAGAGGGGYVLKYSSQHPPAAAAGVARPLLHLLVAAVRLGVPWPTGWSWGKPETQVGGGGGEGEEGGAWKKGNRL